MDSLGRQIPDLRATVADLAAVLKKFGRMSGGGSDSVECVELRWGGSGAWDDENLEDRGYARTSGGFGSGPRGGAGGSSKREVKSRDGYARF